MNTRIQTLLAKFKETESTRRGAKVLVGHDEIEKFAQLIVQECESVSIRNSHRDDDMGAIIARKIKQHFGVE